MTGSSEKFIRRLFVLSMVVALAFSPGAGCGRKRSYSQSTPDDVVRSAVEMVKNGDTKQLGQLIYADSAEMRIFLDRLGDLFGHMQLLAAAVDQKFPAEMEELKRKAAEAVAQGKADPLLSAVAGAASGMGGRGRRGANREPPSLGNRPVDEDQAMDLMNRLFADPYGWIERNAGRLSALKTTDDTASVMLDDKPLIPVVGLPMRMEDQKWYIALPTTFPGIADVMPRGKEQWSILCSTVKVLDRTVIEMTADVKSGGVTTLDSLGKRAREKAMLPAAIAFAAYGKELDIRNRVDRRIKQFQARTREWVKGRPPPAAEGDDKPAVSPKLIGLLNRIAPAKLEPLVRKSKAPAFDGMSTGDYETLIATWLAEAGLAVQLDGELADTKVEAEVARWEAQHPASGNIARVKKK